ncbi:hypothetical protein P7C71_g4727, partial [Lecanoromycetidae sp. Uapishka_2]
MASSMAAKIHGAEAIIGHTFANQLLLWEALQAAGSPVHMVGTRRLDNGNKRLAVLGDTVLQLALVEDWYEGNTPRGHYDSIRQQVASNVNLSSVCRQSGLDACINRSPSQMGHVSPITTCATVEAVLGAVYLDSDMNSVKRVMITLGLT